MASLAKITSEENPVPNKVNPRQMATGFQDTFEGSTRFPAREGRSARATERNKRCIMTRRSIFEPNPCSFELIPCYPELISLFSRIDSLFRRAGNSSPQISQMPDFPEVFETDFHGERPIPKEFPVDSLLPGHFFRAVP
jgi:hypothetical protein